MKEEKPAKKFVVAVWPEVHQRILRLQKPHESKSAVVARAVELLAKKRVRKAPRQVFNKGSCG